MISGRVLKYTISLLNVDHVQLDSRWNYKNVISPYHRIYYIDDGEGEISDTEKSLKLERGYLYIIPSYTLCDLRCKEHMSQYFVQFFEESTSGTSLFGNARFIFKVAAEEIDILNFKRLIKINPGRGINRSNDPKIYEKSAYYREYQALNHLQSQSDFLETQGILLQLIARFSAPEMFYKRNYADIPAKVLDAMRFISINLHQELSVSLLADRYNLHAQYFSRLFEQHTGVGPQAYIMQKRIERARYMILSGSASYTEIAELTGFKGLSSFSRAFKNETGLSPSSFREKSRDNIR